MGPATLRQQRGGVESGRAQRYPRWRGFCFRVARRMSFTTCSDDTLVVSDF